MKRVLALLTALLLISSMLMLVGCGNDDNGYENGYDNGHDYYTGESGYEYPTDNGYETYDDYPIEGEYE